MESDVLHETKTNVAGLFEFNVEVKEGLFIPATNSEGLSGTADIVLDKATAKQLYGAIKRYLYG